ncbi:MAG: hypothetical protein F6K19_51290, partial [Cyanothece sp. SIO1E1]|nr:hypothetical protein [Cyanothece sp. SIO1E1]
MPQFKIFAISGIVLVTSLQASHVHCTEAITLIDKDELQPQDTAIVKQVDLNSESLWLTSSGSEWLTSSTVELALPTSTKKAQPSPEPQPSSAKIPIRQVEVIGSTVFDAADFEPILRPLADRSVTLDDLTRAAD